MIDIFLLILHDLNMTTTNILYFIFGVVITTLVHSAFNKDDVVKIFHSKASELYDSFGYFGIDRNNLMALYNKLIIRSISILALNGEINYKSYEFIDNEVAKITGLSRESATILCDTSKRFLVEMQTIRDRESSRTFLNKLKGLIIKRGKNH